VNLAKSINPTVQVPIFG